MQIPQGSLFVEVNCTRNPNTPTAPSDLYSLKSPNAPWNPISNPWCLNLSKMAPDGNPIWRIMISQSRLEGQNNDLLDQGAPNYIGTHPETTTFEPTTDPNAQNATWQRMNWFDTQGTQQVTCDRAIWLGSTKPQGSVFATASNPLSWTAAPNVQIYYNRTGNILIPPGSYAVVGPRTKTYIGSQGTFDSVGTWGKPSEQSISLTTPMSANSIIGPGGAPNMPGATAANLKSGIFSGQGVVAAADPPLSAYWSNATAYAAQSAPNAGIGVNISEPIPAGVAGGKSTYYPQPTVQNTAIPGGSGPYDSYGGLDQTGPHFPDQPLEDRAQNPVPSYPLVQENIWQTRTNSHYRTLFLQRLADPSSGYDATRNPYITVDWMPVDLTVFNGEDTAAHKNPGDANAANPAVEFTSRERGGSTSATASSPAYNPSAPNLWANVQQCVSLGNKTPVAAV